jgi:hypothetical protein
MGRPASVVARTGSGQPAMSIMPNDIREPFQTAAGMCK